MLHTKDTPTISIREAHNLWDILNSKYLIMEKMLVYEGFVHDLDLKGTCKLMRRPIEKNITILEKELSTYSIPSPDQNRAAAQLHGDSDSITDEYIAMDLFLYLQEHVENLLSTFYSSFANDSLRKTIRQMTSRTISETNFLVHYLRAKGWMEKPPMIKDDLAAEAKALSLVEAASLHDHLTYRYDTNHITAILATIAHDLDLQAVLKLGLTRLTKQIELLEERLKIYHVPFPKRPGKFTLTLQDARFFNDDTIYRIINSFMQGAGAKHAKAFKQATSNDEIREFFRDLLLDEMEVFDDFVKFGKVKGWLNPVPTYVP